MMDQFDRFTGRKPLQFPTPAYVRHQSIDRKKEPVRTVRFLEVKNETQISLDTVAAVEVDSQKSPTPQAIPQAEGIQSAAQSARSSKMVLTFKSLSKNQRNAFYTGAATVLRIGLSAFPNKTAPQSFEVADGVFAASKESKPKLTAEERKAARAAKPKPTLAELAAKAQERANKLAAKAAAAANQPSL